MNEHLQIITTGDGSHSLLNTSLNETYHSVHGALRESLHVFIKNGLEYFCERSPNHSIKIFEVGFGTGLNALLAAQFAAEKNRNIHYTSIEAFPLAEEIWSKLNYADSGESKETFRKIQLAGWNKDEEVSPAFTLAKIRITLQEILLYSSSYDIIFFDAFAPGKQPELWSFDLLKKIEQSMKSPSVFVTYCAKGQLKRDLKGLNLTVETLPGPPGKKEMVRALKI